MEWGLRTDKSKLIFTVVFLLLLATMAQATVTLTENNGTFDGNLTALNFCNGTDCNTLTELLATFNISYDHPSGDNTSVQINTAANDSHRIFNFLNMSGKLFLNADPISNLEPATKEYVDTAVAGVGVTFFLTNFTSNITSYYNLSSTDTSEAESSIVSSTLGTGEQQVIFNYSTIISEPTFDTLSVGVYNFHYHAAKTTGTKDVELSWELYNISPDGGVENLLMVSENATLTTVKIGFNIHAVLSNEVELSAGDRLLLRISAHAASGGSNAIVTIYQEGGTDSNIQIRTTTAAFDDRFVNTGGDTMTGNLGLGSNLLLGTDMGIGYGNNTDYPAACTGDQFIRGLADAPTCAAPITWSNTTFNESYNHPSGDNTTLQINTAANDTQRALEYLKMGGEFNISTFNITPEDDNSAIYWNGTCWIFQAAATKLAVCK